MPCSYYAPGEEAQIARQNAEDQAKRYKDDLTKLTLEADTLRDLVIEFMEGGSPEIPKEQKAKIKRQEDASPWWGVPWNITRDTVWEFYVPEGSVSTAFEVTP